MNYSVGNRVRVVDTPHSESLPIGTTGTVIEVVEPLGYFVEADGDLIFGPRFITGDGYPLNDSELEIIE